MTDPRPADMLLRGYGVDDVKVSTGLTYAEILKAIWASSHRNELFAHHKLCLRRAINEALTEPGAA